MGTGPGLDEFGLQRIAAALERMSQVRYIIITGSVPDKDGTCFARLVESYIIKVRGEAYRPWILCHSQVESFEQNSYGDVRQAIEVARNHDIQDLLVDTELLQWLKLRRWFRKLAPQVHATLLKSGNRITIGYGIKEIVSYALSLLPAGVYGRIIALHHGRVISKKGGGS
jgi:hypothetical protein